MTVQQIDLFDQPIPPRVEQLTFNQAMRFWIRVYWSKKKMYANTGSFIRYMLTAFDGQMLQDIGKMMVSNLISDLEKGRIAGQKEPLGPSGTNKCLTILRLMFKFYEEIRDDKTYEGHDFSLLKLPMRNPGNRVAKKKEPTDDRFFSPWDVRIWVRLARQMGDDGLARAVRLGLKLRLSPIDLIEFNDDEIFEQEMKIRVYRRHTRTSKNPQGCLQVIDITEKTWGQIQTLKRFRNPGEKRILDLYRNKRRRIAKLRKAWRAMGGRDFTTRHFRRSGSGYLFTKGFDLETISKGLGHTSTRPTREYYVPPHSPRLKEATLVLERDFDS